MAAVSRVSGYISADTRETRLALFRLCGAGPLHWRDARHTVTPLTSPSTGQWSDVLQGALRDARRA